MADFIVSARKYRPATFDTVVGQSAITTTLKNAIKNNHLAQAFLFCGPRGVGKTTCARILAKTINCFNPTPTIEACDECESCKSFNSGASLNVYELDAASNNSVDDIRNLVDQVRFAPQLGKYKVYIIDEVHMLSQAAFNAFLKTLEEPPRHAIFILATTERHKILPTILSRCQIFNFNRIQVDDIANHLAYIAKNEGVTAEPDALHVIAQKADGALRDACSIFDQVVSFAGNNLTYKAVIENLNVLDYDYYFRLTDLLLAENIPSALLLFNEVLSNGFDGHHFIAGVAEHFRNLLVCKDPQTLQLLEAGQAIREKYKEQSSKCAQNFLLRALSLANKCDAGYKAARNPRLHVEFALMQLCSLNPTGAEEKKNLDGSEPFAVKPVIGAPKINAAAITTTTTTMGNGLAVQQNVPQKTTEEKTVVPQTQQQPVTAKTETAQNTAANATPPATGQRKLKTLSSMQQFVGGGNNNLKKEEPADNVLQEPRATYSQPAEPFTSEQLEAAWAAYAQELRNNKRISLSVTLTMRKPVLASDELIVFTVDNQSQVEDINSERADLMSFVRRRLNNYKIQLQAVVTKNDSDRKAYTADDKYKRLLAMNPVMAEFRKAFELEVEM